MEWVVGIVTQTPAWVYLLLVYLVLIGIKARRPGQVSLTRLAIVPALLTAWGLHDLVRLYGIEAGTVLPWLGALGLGVLLGLWLRGRAITVDRTRGLIHRPADGTVLPLVPVAFALKYMFGVGGAVSPATLEQPLWRPTDLGAYGLFAGIFVGKFLGYLLRYLRAAGPRRPAPHLIRASGILP